MRFALALLDIMLLACPREFRRAYRSEMRRDFRANFEEEAHLHGSFGSGGYALNTYVDIVATGVRERGTMMLRDLLYTFRSLRRTPLFALVVIATLALAIGANAAVFSVLGGVLLKPLPYPHPEALTALYQTDRHSTKSPWSYPNISDVRAQNTSFTEVAAFTNASGTLVGHGRPRRLIGEEVTSEFFDVVNVQPQIGRSFIDSDARESAAKTIVISDNVWRTSFNADPRVLGTTLELDGVAYEIIGVAPAGFVHPDSDNGLLRLDFWRPFHPNRSAGTDQRGSIFLRAIARLKPQVSLETASRDLTTIMARLAQRYVNSNKHAGARAVPLEEAVLGPVKPLLFGVFAAVAGLLLVACANVANLLLSRAATRERELAVRYAIGASRGRIIAQILTETLVFAVSGGVLGIALAVFAVNGFIALHPPGIPRLDSVTFDLTAAVYTLIVVLVCTLLAGIIPALAMSRINLGSALKAAGRGGDSSQGARARSIFVITEIAITLALVIASGLVARSFFTMVATPLGFDPANVSVVNFGTLPDKRYGRDAQVLDFQRRVLARVQAIPGVKDAGFQTVVPFGRTRFATSFVLPEKPMPPGEERVAGFDFMSAGTFNVLQMPLVRGRLFNEGDKATARRVIIVNETFARTNYGTLDVIGKTLIPGVAASADARNTPRTIVGVIADNRDAYARTPDAKIYAPSTQLPETDGRLLVRTQPGANITAELIATLTSIDALMPAPTVRSLSSLIADDAARTRISAIALATLAGIALFLATAGVYAVVSYGVTQRTHEFGIRIALGAKASNIVRNVIGRAVRLALIGVGFGIVLAGFAAQLVSAQLYGIGTVDPLTYGTVVVILIVAALIAAFIPALRATRVDPIVALRYE